MSSRLADKNWLRLTRQNPHCAPTGPLALKILYAKFGQDWSGFAGVIAERLHFLTSKVITIW